MTLASKLFATAPKGLENLLADELRALGAADAREQRGGVVFSGGLELAYRACLWSRIANRVLLPLASFEAPDADALYRGVLAVDWANHLAANGTLAVDVTGVQAAIGHSRYAAQRVKDAVVDQFRERSGERPSVDTGHPDIRINVHLLKTRATLALDLSGESLHRRGYREPGVAAPLKENLAAAVLLRAGWPEIAAAGGALVDPMCGSGTLLIESAWLAGDVAPGLLRTYFGFLGWAGHDDALWKQLVDEALDRQEAGTGRIPPIVGYDRDAVAVRTALANVRRAGLTGTVHVERRELADAEPPPSRGPGLVAVNPPYGERLGADRSLLPLYARLGETLKQRFGGWQAVMLTGADLEIGLKPERRWTVFNGPIQCRLEKFHIAEQEGAVSGRAEDLVNRLRKNQRALAPWLKQSGVSCYRVYDADIPEYARAIDVYGTERGDWVHVQEYEPPRTVNSRDAQARLRAALAVIPEALSVSPECMVYKVRKRQKGGEQYQRQSDSGRFLEVREGPCRLWVNLPDYLDTGLFLDHRPVREYVRQQAAGKRVLNLFCYTGAVTVHAAVGGAAATDSVDLSRTYLDWAARNLRLNGITGGQHRLLQADCREWLMKYRGEPYDMIFLDPPSFSNSKRMDGTLDVPRDHVALIDYAARALSPDGLLVFSTNLRRFRLDESALEALQVEDRSAWSIPRDFRRNQRIHRCWFIRKAVS
ncbi:MAG: bifunctional 23S rRNA (guanine(2069)-N(7))-methyltransferase RlmK/23S rRNA (guanine(2445)-N(2))-methyltransferase RlmL [Ectothiorhodospiraceae bacterium]|nr:bifunctional 23S rRNA (guanine(2069)-N(7))-methyltransferase RlmK/23S rRNA (guanine(2445)-N(2))-methyltransferase RlmL [Ectothiorhodospiraceae bacterium]